MQTSAKELRLAAGLVVGRDCFTARFDLLGSHSTIVKSEVNTSLVCVQIGN
jgi:hypothetical protein